MGKRFAIVIGVAAAGVMALGAQTAAASAGVVAYNTKLTGHWEHSAYLGSVKSKVHKCETGRRVVVFKVKRPGADRKVGADRSDRQGHWLVYPPQGGGLGGGGRRFYAKVRPKSGNGWVCRADRAYL